MLIPTEPQNYYGNTTDNAERFVQSALDALSAHIAILDENGTIVGINVAWRNFAITNGYRDSTYGIGMNYLGVCDGASERNSKDAPIVASGIRDIMQGKLSEFELEYPCHSPLQQRWFVVRVSRFIWQQQARYVVSHQNVTELKSVQLELSQSKQRIEAILDNVNNGILTVDADGNILTANRAVMRIFGYQADVLVGTHLSAVLAESFQNQLIPQKLDGELGHELVGRRADGSTFPMYLSLNELQLDGRMVYTCIIQDVTWLKQMEAERLERERMGVALDKERELRALKNRFLSMMSHELRTPLTSISLSYDMLKKYGLISTVEEKDQALDNIRSQVDFLAEMVSDVMTLSRSEADGFQISRERSDLITYCRDVVEEFQFNYHNTHRIEFECTERTLVAVIDRKLLRRALTNLLSNAVKYSPQGGLVTFTLTAEGEFAMIFVSDQGIGIPPEDQPRLFEPFHRAGNVDNVPGTGLGLAITKQLIELHGGDIQVESTVGVGTRFFVMLPLA